MTALAVLACVVVVCASALLAWRWWLDTARAKRVEAVRDLDAEWAKLASFEKRLTSLEYARKG